MATVLGNIEAADDYMHPLGPEQNFNESVYFNVFDRARGIGGFVRIGNRANEGYAEMTVCLFLPDGRVLFQYKRPPISNNEAFDAGGLKIEVLEPSQRLRTVYNGSAVELRDPAQMADPSFAFKNNPIKRISLDLVHEAVGPMYGHKEEGPAADPEKEFARAHFEQHMRASGSLTIEDETYQIDGFGLRDHSWGPRYWQAIDSYRWLTCNFGPDFGFMGSIVWPDASHSQPRQGGVVVRDGKLTNVSSIEIETRYAENGLYHEGFSARLQLEGGETLTVEGTVKGFIPLRNRRQGQVTHIGEGMTEYRCGQRIGYGLSEYLDQVR
jgi:hypothetical protein